MSQQYLIGNYDCGTSSLDVILDDDTIEVIVYDTSSYEYTTGPIAVSYHDHRLSKVVVLILNWVDYLALLYS